MGSRYWNQKKRKKLTISISYHHFGEFFQNDGRPSNKEKKAAIKKTTIKDVAALADVSIKTVSRVVNKESNLREATRDKVLKAIKKLNYTPNLSARGLAGHHSFLFAVLYDNPSANYILDIQNGVLKECRKEGFDLLIYPCEANSKKLYQEIIELVKKSRVAGLILTPPLSDMAPLQKKLKKEKIPFVRIAPTHHDLISPFVHCDDQTAACRMTEHLLSLGHSDIAFIKGHPDHGASELRLAGYKKALKQAGLPINRTFIRQGQFDFNLGVRCGKELLTMDPPPTAIFACNDDMAAGVLYLAHQMKVSVPQQLSVVGFDDSPVAQQVWPALTTVKQPIIDMAQSATAVLIANLRKNTTQNIVQAFECTLAIRDSTSAI
ncbi:MAG: LacI family DNA-binding transcriptional regulator [Cellvibrionaceae bacterium]